MFGQRLTPFQEAQYLQNYNPELIQREGMGLAFLIPLIASLVGSAVSTGGAIVAGQRRTNSQLKVMATTATDEVERQLAANRDWLLGLSNPTVEERQAAADFFYAQWNAWADKMTPLGEPGQRAVNERKRGGVNSWGKDWWELYLDPILNTQVITGTPNTGGGGSNNTVNTSGVTPPSFINTPTVTVETVGGMDMGKVVIVLGGLGLAWWVMSKK